MKTILVVYTNERLSVEQINNRKMQKYCFRTESEVTVGDVLKSKNYNANMVVTDVVDTDYKYYNAQSGEMTNSINSTKCYPIKTMVLREEDESVVYASKVNIREITYNMTQENKVITEKEREEKRKDTLRKMRTYSLHASEVDMLEEAGEL